MTPPGPERLGAYRGQGQNESKALIVDDDVSRDAGCEPAT
jgi:hypothetical protein